MMRNTRQALCAVAILAVVVSASAGHVHLLHRPAALQEDLDEDVRHGIGVLPNLIDLLI